MKIEIDLNDILGDENGAETLQDSVRRQVIDSVTATIKKGVGTQINQAVSETINTEIETYLKNEMPNLLANLMNAEYTPVGRYGDQGTTTSFRQELVRSITENMTYRRANYESEKNAFTKAVDSIVSEQVAAFKEDFKKQVDSQFTAYALAAATEALKKKLGIA